MNHLSERQTSQIRNLVLLTGIATTLMIWTSLADPINLPKMVVLTILSAWIFGTLTVSIFTIRPFRFSMGQWAVVAFVLGILVAALLTDVKYIAFFGTMLRNDGAFSYFSLAILALASMMSFEYANLERLRLSVLLVGMVLTLHGLLQTFGHDPFKWVLLYNPVIGTLGNPDFLSATIGSSAIATLWFIYSEKKRWMQGLGLLLLIVELFVIKRSGSFQGLVAFVFGLSILALTWFWQMNKRYGIIGTIFAGLGLIPVFLGLLDKGPLAAHIYRASLKNRIDYWHAAFNMFKAHPFFGVGLDRFGENYGRYAPQIQVVQGQPTNNAHNVFLQLLATGGLVVTLPYLFLLSVIFVSSIKAIKGTSDQRQMDLVALFAIWLAFLLISSVSIDNLGVVVWFWIIGGALYGITRESKFQNETKLVKKKTASKKSKGKSASNRNSIASVAPIVSLISVILTLIVMVPAWRGSSSLQTIQRYRSGLTQTQFADYLKRIASTEPNNTQTSILLGGIALNFSQNDLALYFAHDVNKKDPLSSYGQELGASAYEAEKKYEQAIPYRVRLLEIDRWNTASMVILVKDYLAINDKAQAAVISKNIAQLYPNSADAKAAAALIKG